MRENYAIAVSAPERVRNCFLPDLGTRYAAADGRNAFLHALRGVCEYGMARKMEKKNRTKRTF